MKNKGKTMNLKTYLETNNFEKKDLTILFSVGCVLNVKNGDTFPMMDDNTFDFEDGMNVVTDEFDEYWWESLAKWNGDKQIVEDTIERLSEVSYVDSLLTTGFDNEPTEAEWLEQKAELALGV